MLAMVCCFQLIQHFGVAPDLRLLRGVRERQLLQLLEHLDVVFHAEEYAFGFLGRRVRLGRLLLLSLERGG